MPLPLRVLGDRVLIRPDVNRHAPEQSAGGVFLAKSLAAAVTGEDVAIAPCRGTVVALGRPRHPLRDEAFALAATLERHRRSDEGLETDAAQLLRDLVRRDPCVAIGDDVLFGYDAGQETVIDDETYLILREAELLAIVETVPEGVV